MRTVVVVILLLAPLVLGQAQTDPQNGIVEFYTTQSPAQRPVALDIYSGDQKLGEVTLDQVVRFSGAPGPYSFALRPYAPVTEQVSVSLRDGQHLYFRVTSEGFYAGSAGEAVRPLPGRAPSGPANTSVANAANTKSTIFFYRDRQGPSQQVTVYSLFVAGSHPVATLQKGEYFAMSVSPGMTAFSWTSAPARGQTFMLDVGRGQQIFLKVQPSGITPIDNDTARMSFQDLQTIDRTRIFDNAHVVDEVVTLPIQTAAESGDRQSRPNAQVSRINLTGDEQTAPKQSPVPQKPANKKPDADGQPQPTVRQTTSQQQPKETAKTRPIKIHGYVTAVTPTAFEIDDYRVIRDEAVTMQFENQGADIQFNIESVKVGTELDIKGDFDDKTQVVRAKTIKVDLEQFRKLKNTAVLAHPPVGLVRSENGWTGTFVADGQRVRVSPETKMSFRLTGGGTEKTEPDIRPLASPEEITTGMLITYEGVRDLESGVILADSVEFARNEFDKGEQDLWTRSMVRFKSADSSTPKPGELSELGELNVPGVGKFKLVPNEEVQEYVTKIGKSLIPKYALSTAQTDPSRFRFQFYVVINNEPVAFALPTGVFVIYSGMFAALQNEAQLAALMGHEMSHVMEEHQWREIQERKTLKTPSGVTVAETFGRRTLRDVESLTAAAIRNGYTRDQENQADRDGLEYMVNAGYDPREAPKVWTAIAKATGFKGNNSFYNTYDNHANRRSYLLNQIRDNYSALNFANLRIEETGFKRMTNLANEAVSGKIQAVLQGER